MPDAEGGASVTGDDGVAGYTLHGVLGRGGHAEVHRAEPVDRPGRVVAVKRFGDAPTRDRVRAVRHEAEALERLSHPSIVRLLDVAADGDGVALVTPFLPGGTLADRIARGPLPPAAVADLGARLGDALAAAHGAGVVHRDVKPANVLYDAEEQPLLTDFGAAVLAGAPPADTVGTATYLDPEVVTGGAAPGPASDQYALGVTLYEALAGVPPYAAPTVEATLRAADRGVHVPLTQLAPDAPAAVTDAIERAIARDPDARFATVRELASRLEEARTGLDTWVGPGAGARGGSRLPTSLDPDPTPAGPPPLEPWRPVPPAPGASRVPAAATAPPVGAVAGRPGPDGSDDPTLTRRFGPAPPPRDAPPAPPRRRVPSLLAALVVLLVPAAVVLALLLGGGEDPTETTSDPTPATGTDVTGAADLEPCADAPPLPAGAGEPVPADTAGRGCTVELGWDAATRILTVPRTDGDPVRYQLGEAGDVLVVGDWSCDGRQTPGLYRPATGEVFTFDGYAGDGGELESLPAQATGVVDGDPVVTRGADGCDRVEVRGDA